GWNIKSIRLNTEVGMFQLYHHTRKIAFYEHKDTYYEKGLFATYELKPEQINDEKFKSEMIGNICKNGILRQHYLGNCPIFYRSPADVLLKYAKNMTTFSMFYTYVTIYNFTNFSPLVALNKKQDSIQNTSDLCL